jgi:glycosyltransferase involved in cell wall biosynthesis
MVKILLILNRFNLGGPTYYAGFLTKYLGDDFETVLVGGKNGDYEESSSFILDELGVKYSLIPELQREINPYKDFIAYKKIKAIIKREKPDIIHTHAAKAGILGRMAAIEEKVPVIVHTFHGHVFHSYFGKLKTNMFISLEKYFAKHTNKIITISPLQKKEIQGYLNLPDSKLTTLPIGIDIDKFRKDRDVKRQLFREKYNIATNVIAIGIVGRLVNIKNHEMFIKAFSMLKRYLPDKKNVKAFIVGNGELKEELIRVAKRSGLNVWQAGEDKYNADIYFTSWIKDMTYVYNGLDIVALTSLNEGTPITLIEAQASGTPVVATRVGGVPDTMQENITGLLSPSKDVYNFYYNMLKLVLDYGLRMKMGAAGYDFVKGKYDYSILVENMRNLYLTLLYGEKIAESQKVFLTDIKEKELVFD